MTPTELQETIDIGETATVEFKRCGNQPERDCFETICSFSNRFGGSIFLGVSDNGTVEGIPESSLPAIKRNIVNVTNNADLFDPPVIIEFEKIRLQGKSVLRVWVPTSSTIHRFKGVVFDRVEDADIRIKGSDALSMMYLRKQGIYSEQQIFPYLTESDLMLERMGDYRRMAYAKRADHPWRDMSDREILKSMRLYATDYATGAQGFNRAAALLLGRDDVIAAISPAYKTDVVLRVNDINRYDDRLTVATNLPDAYRLLIGFVTKYLPDPFYLEGDHATSIRDVIVRETIVNSLIHREYLSPRPALISIEQGRLVASNASRANFQGRITPDNLVPQPKNPIIGRFFNQIGLAEELGSGTKNLFRYATIYGGSEPLLEEGDVFTTIIPLPSFATPSAPAPTARAIHKELTTPREPTSHHNEPDASERGRRGEHDAALPNDLACLLDARGFVSAADVARLWDISTRTAQRRLARLVEQGALVASGTTRGRRYRQATS